MASGAPVESFGELVGRFPGIDELDPKAIGRMAFSASKEMPNEALRFLETGEEPQPWHEPVRGILEEVHEWRSWKHEEVSRPELISRIMRSQREENTWNAFMAALDKASADDGYAMVVKHLEEHGYHIQVDVGPSPLFPQGRTAYLELEDAKNSETGLLNMPSGSTLVDQEDIPVRRDIEDYLEKGHSRQKSREAVEAALAGVEPIDPAEFKRLCDTYGAKAAGLMSFNERTAALNEALKETSHAVRIEVPPFLAAEVDLYERWLDDPSALPEISESLRIRAAKLKEGLLGADQTSLVAVRSSAVKSEDGEEHTGAGVYKSVAVDPNDSEAFQKAIQEVYESTRSPAALSYQRSIGVTDEKMGLVIQHYEEGSSLFSRRETFYGHANGRGANPNILEVNTNQGTLLYDKPAVQAMLLLDSTEMWNEDILHSSPDRDSPLKDALSPVLSIPHAVILAEQIFGKPMQVEFVNGAVVQVRPLILNLPEASVSFPEDMEVLAESAATGVGDMELKMLDDRDDNSDEKGFVVFSREYAFTLGHGHASYDALPKEGAVVVLKPSSSGHIQALCREKGLLCFMPKKGSSIDHIEDAMSQDDGDSQDDPEDIILRFVSDGYEGRIYKV